MFILPSKLLVHIRWFEAFQCQNADWFCAPLRRPCEKRNLTSGDTSKFELYDLVPFRCENGLLSRHKSTPFQRNFSNANRFTGTISAATVKKLNWFSSPLFGCSSSSSRLAKSKHWKWFNDYLGLASKWSKGKDEEKKISENIQSFAAAHTHTQRPANLNLNAWQTRRRHRAKKNLKMGKKSTWEKEKSTADRLGFVADALPECCRQLFFAQLLPLSFSVLYVASFSSPLSFTQMIFCVRVWQIALCCHYRRIFQSMHWFSCARHNKSIWWRQFKPNCSIGRYINDHQFLWWTKHMRFNFKLNYLQWVHWVTSCCVASVRCDALMWKLNSFVCFFRLGIDLILTLP